MTSPVYTRESKYLERLLLTRSSFFGIFGASFGPNRDRVEILNRRACCPEPHHCSIAREEQREAPGFPARHVSRQGAFDVSATLCQAFNGERARVSSRLS